MGPPFGTFAEFTYANAINRVWDATAGAPPGATDAWRQPGYDDSAWTDPAVTTPVGGHTYLYRSRFTASAVPYQPYYFGSSTNQIWLNGNEMIGAGRVGAITIFAPAPGSDVLVAASGIFTDYQLWYYAFYIPDAGGQPYAWGTITAAVNDKGVLGLVDLVTHLTPALVDLSGGMPATIVKVASNGKTTLFLDNVGNVYVCGDNSTGLHGNGTTDASAHPTPTLITTNSFYPATDISIGTDCAIVCTRSAEFFLWGPNASGSVAADLLPHLTPTEIGTAVGGLPSDIAMSAGRNFVVFGKGAKGAGVLLMQSSGDNTYGQLGQGTTGGTGWLAGNRVGVAGITEPVVQVSAGDDQTLFTTLNDHVWVCGRADYGSLGSTAYAAGTGVNKIVSTPMNALLSVGYLGNGKVAQAGPVSFLHTPVYIGGLPLALGMVGDGVPHGGAGDNDNTVIYGKGGGFDLGTVIQKIVGFLGPSPTGFLPRVIAETSGGSHNAWAGGDSKATFAAVGFYQDASSGSPSFDFIENHLLFTWGYGGYGQHGDGGTADQTWARSVNGLTNVQAACVVDRAIFAISSAASRAGRGRSFGSVV